IAHVRDRAPKHKPPFALPPRGHNVPAKIEAKRRPKNHEKEAGQQPKSGIAADAFSVKIPRGVDDRCRYNESER
ncbi:MAG: hypothetical protein RLY82_1243, partial [Pseudomonadota bacterium]